jgi:3-dehydroquinate synthase
MIRHVVLTGLSGTGKTSVGRVVASEPGWRLVDTDAEIERRTGRTIPDIFRDDGEAAFRAIESEVMRAALTGDQVVIATGGGAVLDPGIWADNLLGAPDSLVVWLDTDSATLVGRLQAQAAEHGAAADRPLLADGDPLAKLTAMRNQRLNAYSRADIVLDVTNRDVADVGQDIVELVRLGSGAETVVDLDVGTARSAIHVGLESRFTLGELAGRRWPKARQIWVVIDGNLEPFVEPVIAALRTSSTARVNTIAVAPGEGSKSLAGLARLYDWMLGGGVERGDVVVAMGGGMVGDLSGFAAASVLRGIGLVQVPTTLLSMVDSSVGGKTGINHETGKNLIGAFYQPPEVVIDPGFLASLPLRERRSGWAEIIKHAVIEQSTPGGDPPVLFDVLERNVSALADVKMPITPWLIRRNVSLKAAVVQADEREAGIRAYLNFGHTIGHGIEAAGYRLLHGEAVAVGMCAALSIARERDAIDPVFERRVRDLIVAYGLPVRAEIDVATVRAKMASDKKKSAGIQKWILPRRGGGVTMVMDVADEAIDRAIQSVTEQG